MPLWEDILRPPELKTYSMYNIIVCIVTCWERADLLALVCGV